MSYFKRTAKRIKQYFSKLWHSICHPKESKSYDMTGMDEHHKCLNCDYEYEGNYCPRCGQSAATSRLTPKKIIGSTLGVWDYNDRSVLSTVIQLFLRPGHFIRDYLKGHRAPYYAPIKLLFFLCVLYAVEVHVNLIKTPQGERIIINRGGSQEVTIPRDSLLTQLKTIDSTMTLEEQIKTKRSNDISLRVVDELYYANNWRKNNRGFFIIILNISFAFIAWLLFLRTRKDLRFSFTEHFFIQIFISCQILVVTILVRTFSSGSVDTLDDIILPFIMAWDYKQIYEMSIWKSIGKTLALILLNMLFLGVVFFIAICLMIYITSLTT